MYDAARIALKETKAPQAFLHLGTLYAKGIGTRENHVLANYFYEKALALGCQEAEEYILKEYECGNKDLFKDLENAFANTDTISPLSFNRFKRLIERERIKKNYGILSRIRKHLHHFYPDYTKKKAINDIMNDRDTVNADLLYATSTSDNRSEYNIDVLESLLQQLFAPVYQDKKLFRRIIESKDVDLYEQDEIELIQCVVNLAATYDNICAKFGIVPQRLMTIDELMQSPYIKVSTLALLRQQAFRCLLSLKDINPIINDKFLNTLDSDEGLLNISEEIKDQDVQLFLISFVELNIDADTLEFKYQELLSAYKHQRMAALARRLNEYLDRLTEAGIKHQFSYFTPKDLPFISVPTTPGI